MPNFIHMNAENAVELKSCSTQVSFHLKLDEGLDIMQDDLCDRDATMQNESGGRSFVTAPISILKKAVSLGTGTSYIQLDNNASGNVASGDFSFAGYVKILSSSATHNMLFSKTYAYGAGQTTPGFYMSFTESAYNLCLRNDSTDEYFITNASGVSVGAWNHIAFTCKNNGTSREVKYYLNGLINSTTSETMTVPTLSNVSYFCLGYTNGYNPEPNRYGWFGLSDIYFYHNHLLTAEEVFILSKHYTV